MTERKYLELMIALKHELERVRNTRPYDHDAYNEVIESMNRLSRIHYLSHLRRPWVMNLVYIAAILLVLYLVYCIVSEGFF